MHWNRTLALCTAAIHHDRELPRLGKTIGREIIAATVQKVQKAIYEVGI